MSTGIKYGDDIEITLLPGQSALLKCNGKKMLHDLSIIGEHSVLYGDEPYLSSDDLSIIPWKDKIMIDDVLIYSNSSYNKDVSYWLLNEDADIMALQGKKYFFDMTYGKGFATTGLDFADDAMYVMYDADGSHWGCAVTVKNGANEWESYYSKHLAINQKLSTVENGLELFNWLNKNATPLSFIELQGVWKFNDTLTTNYTYSPNIKANFELASNITSNRTEYSKTCTTVRFSKVADSTPYYLLEYTHTNRWNIYDTALGAGTKYWYKSTTGWATAVAKTITITDDTATIVKNNGVWALSNFLEWFTANAYFESHSGGTN